MRVLICDDNPKIITQIKKYLLEISKNSRYKFDYVCFTSGEDILTKQIKIDFAFIDIEMPGVNGLTVTKHLQKINPNIIIFIITSFQGYLDDAMDLKVFRFLLIVILLHKTFYSGFLLLAILIKICFTFI